MKPILFIWYSECINQKSELRRKMGEAVILAPDYWLLTSSRNELPATGVAKQQKPDNRPQMGKLNN
jgi:hypothetical protein